MMSTMEREQSCEQRLPDHLSGRLADFADMGRRAEAAYNAERYDEADEITTEQWQYPLDVEILTTVKILLSTGGPADWFECRVDDDRDIVSIDYVFQDWFDGARVTLEGNEFEAARDFLGQFVESALINQG